MNNIDLATGREVFNVYDLLLSEQKRRKQKNIPLKMHFDAHGRAEGQWRMEEFDKGFVFRGS